MPTAVTRHSKEKARHLIICPAFQLDPPRTDSENSTSAHQQGCEKSESFNLVCNIFLVILMTTQDPSTPMFPHSSGRHYVQAPADTIAAVAKRYVDIVLQLLSVVSPSSGGLGASWWWSPADPKWIFDESADLTQAQN